ncbi:MAG TPA: hypothetical protein VMF65_17305 [Acidimicrobiales bacterium]|nr:hypothetical protein [Acidimicrobiales bacterium]
MNAAETSRDLWAQQVAFVSENDASPGISAYEPALGDTEGAIFGVVVSGGGSGAGKGYVPFGSEPGTFDAMALKMAVGSEVLRNGGH